MKAPGLLCGVLINYTCCFCRPYYFLFLNDMHENFEKGIAFPCANIYVSSLSCSLQSHKMAP